MRKLSKLAYGGDQDMMIPFEVYLCGDCGAEQELLKPVQLRALEQKDKLEASQTRSLDLDNKWLKDYLTISMQLQKTRTQSIGIS